MRDDIATFLVAPLLAAALLAAPNPLSAQDYRSSVGWNTGALWVSALNSGAAPVVGGEGEVVALRTRPGLGWTTGLQLDHWLWSGILGVRLGGGYARHNLGWSTGDRGIGTWTGEVGVLARIFAPEPDQVYIPYFALGVAGVRYELGRGPLTTFPQADAYYTGDLSINLAGAISLGLDIVSPWGWDESPIIVRIEAADQVSPRSPLRSLETGKRFHFVHNARLTIGLHAGLGSLLPATERRPPVPVVAGR